MLATARLLGQTTGAVAVGVAFHLAGLRVTPTLLFVALFVFLMRRMSGAGGGGGPLGSLGKSKARRYDATAERTTFADVAGIDEAEEELTEVVGFLKDPERYRRLGGMIPRGVLLSGLPGTGKTLLARAVAGEADVPFFDDLTEAVREAKRRAGDRVVAVCAGDMGGRALALGLVDEVAMDVVPVVFGRGKRYFGPVDSQHLLEDPTVVLQGDRVLHLRYPVRR